MTTPIGSHGTLIKMGNGASPEVFVTIAELGDIDGPAFDRAMHEAHAQDDTYKEYVPGMLGLDQITFDVNFLPDNATHDDTTGLIANIIAGTKHNFQMIFPTSPTTTWTIPCYVAHVGSAEPVDGLLTASVTLQPSGAPSF